MSVYFVLLANCTAHDKVLDESRQTQSPEVAFEDDFSVKDTHVTKKGRRVNGVEVLQYEVAISFFLSSVFHCCHLVHHLHLLSSLCFLTILFIMWFSNQFSVTRPA